MRRGVGVAPVRGRRRHRIAAQEGERGGGEGCEPDGERRRAKLCRERGAIGSQDEVA